MGKNVHKNVVNNGESDTEVKNANNCSKYQNEGKNREIKNASEIDLTIYDYFDNPLFHFFVSFLIPFLCGYFLYLSLLSIFSGINISRLLFSLVFGILGVFFYSLFVAYKSYVTWYIKRGSQGNEDSIPLSDSTVVKNVERTMLKREYARDRLRLDENLSQIINIEYSVFTAILAVLSVADKEYGQFLSVPSAVFTVSVAILVTYANGQSFGRRSNDLKSNCESIRECYNDLLEFSRISTCGDASNLSNDKYRSSLANYYKALSESENPGFQDKWKYETLNSKNPGYALLYVMWQILSWLFIVILIAIPFLFIWKTWPDFSEYIKAVGIHI